MRTTDVISWRSLSELRAAVECPYYDLVPKGMKENLAFRRKLIELARESDEYARELWIMCSRDVLFTINAFMYTYDPRKKDCPVLPFITYPFQDIAILEVTDAVGDHDVLAEKSRDMGATWLYLYVITWHFLFREYQTFLCVSRKEDLVDKPADPDSLFWKVDFMLENLPWFLRPAYTRTRMHYHNEQNGSTIDGSSTTGDVGRGGRRTAIFLDEFASVEDGYAILQATQHNTNCRMFNSTPKGTNNAFYDMTLTDIARLRFHWSNHPEKARGLYTGKDGKLDILDREYPFEPDYEFVLDGKLRSPWYDLQCKRAAHPMEIAQELDIDYLGSAAQFFDPVVIERCIRRDARLPYAEGDLRYDRSLHPREFRPGRGRGDSRLRLWINLTGSGNPPEGVYTAACDVAQGTGASNSVLVVYNNRTREKVAEYANPNLRPDLFGQYAVAVCRWFHDAFLVWEANGPGRIFGQAVTDAGYRKIYWKEKNEKSIASRYTDIPGFFATTESKTVLLGDYRRALDSGEYINRSREALEECLQYIFLPNGAVVHSSSTREEDPSGARESHGDRVVADALAWKAAKRAYKTVEPEKVVLPGSLISRMLERRRAEKARSRFW